ncbi:Sugar transport protein 8 [Camellia lanceoleosa]|uniref:Sugar transport protein 8 n=1 Tax=Camellia lanceoleosa TaxID=1840588 RepID=A0ACC0G045_9ERIC|nr:Sugar transport protein 8 [Camellia lanceoleosa]
MDDFLIKFFPKVQQRKLHAKEDNYCKYDDQLLQLFTSSLYLATLVASFGASKGCRIFGRKPTILVASLFFIGGAGFSALAEHKWMLILGKILFGIGVGFGNEDAPRLWWCWCACMLCALHGHGDLLTRTSSFAFAVSSNMLMTFLVAQAFLSMLCHMQAFIFFFFLAWILVMGLFVVFLVPETKGIPIDSIVERVWKQYLVWKKFMDDDGPKSQQMV